jgi:ATP-dependent helicase HrpB
LLEHHLQLLNREPHHLIWKQAKRWAQRLNCRISIPWVVEDMHSVIAHLLLYAYPDHVAKRRSNGGYQLVNGNGANWLAKDEGDCDAPWLVITQLMAGDQADSQIRLAHPIDEKWVMSAFADKIEVQERVYWHSQKQSIAARMVERLGRIELSSRSTSLSDRQRGKAVILEQIRAQGLAFLAWPESVWQWLARLKLASELFPEEWPELDESKVLDSVETWLSPYLDNVTSLKQLQQLNWLEILSHHWLTWQQQSELKQLLPSHYTSATGRSHPLDYQGHRVTLSIRIQEVYGLSETPCVARGKLPLQLSLLSPAGRPIQTTGDLASFWQGSYKEVQKEMKGRYPKHYWPDDPASAQATSGVKKK